MSKRVVNDVCEVLAWDSAFFGVRIGRVKDNHLTAAQADAVLAWCGREKIDCLYFLADADDAETARTVEARGFVFTDLRLTLARKGVAPPMPNGIRPHREDDIPALMAMARVNHRDSRFTFDGHFPTERCDALYATWIEQSCKGYADAVFVAERDGRAAGYITCDLKDGFGQIGLLGVGEAWQGQGLGGALIDAAVNWCAEQGADTVEVVTQGRNVRAQRAYQRRGFVSARAGVWYHWWG